MSTSSNGQNDLSMRAAAFLLTVAAFCFSATLFLILNKRFTALPPTEAIAIGRVTIDKASKLRDYVGAALFFIVVPIGTLLAERLGRRFLAWLTEGAPDEHTDRLAAKGRHLSAVDIVLFALPFILSPFLFLTTGKEGWGTILPAGIAAAIVLGRRIMRTSHFVHLLFAEELRPFHALLLAAASAWMLFRYIVTGSRIAHIPTLFLEVIFIAFFLLLFEIAAIVITRLCVVLTPISPPDAFRRIAITSIPLTLLPLAALSLWPREAIIAIALGAVALLAILSGPIARRLSAITMRRVLVAFTIPLLLYVASYASMAAPSWLDLFHRGETLGPASDYLRGKVPFREVFALHGLLEDGLLDGWLMQLFGRSHDVAVARIVGIGSFTLPVLFVLGYALFRSIPLALTTAAAGIVTFVDNQRLVFHLAVVALIVSAIARPARSKWFVAGAFSGFAIFYSFDIGLFAITGTLAGLLLVAIARRRNPRIAIRLLPSCLSYLGGVIVGGLPIALYLSTVGAFDDFMTISFVTIPKIIDPVWSIPFPDLGAAFRNDLSLRQVADFLLGERIRFVLNPLVIAVVLAMIVRRWWRGELDNFDAAVVMIAVAAIVAQRTALGRADFRHQYAAAYLLAPLIVALAVISWRRLVASTSDAAARPFRAAVLLIATLAAFVVLWIPDLLNEKLNSITMYRPRLSRIGFNDPEGDAVQARISRIRYLVDAAAAQDEPIFDFSNQPALYFFLDRPNPTRFYQVPILSPAEFQAETIRALEESEAPIVLRGSPERYDRFDEVSNDLRAPAVARYLDTVYQYWRSAAGVELWRRRENVKAQAGALQRVVRVPNVAPREADEQLIFPSIGSFVGAEHARWRSDIMIYNGEKTPLKVRLRYTGDRGSAERDAVAQKYSTLVLADAAASFFGLPNSRGSLTVQYEEGRRPLVTVQTLDETRPDTQTAIAPISSHSAARAKSKADTITILGARTTPTRRANVAIVNTGNGPAKVKIFCRTSDGGLWGSERAATIEEGFSFSVSDIERTMSAPLDGTVAIVVQVEQGAVVAYASVIDSTTGAHYTIAGTAVPLNR